MKPVELAEVRDSAEYERIRPAFRARVIALKNDRRVAVGQLDDAQDPVAGQDEAVGVVLDPVEVVRHPPAPAALVDPEDHLLADLDQVTTGRGGDQRRHLALGLAGSLPPVARLDQPDRHAERNLVGARRQRTVPDCEVHRLTVAPQVLLHRTAERARISALLPPMLKP